MFKLALSSPLQLSRPLGLTFALLSLWLLGALGFAVVSKATSPWLFPPTDDFGLLLMMLGGFYATRAASLLIAVCVAAFVIAHSGFAHPFRVLGGLVGGFYIVSLILRWAFKPPAWQLISDSAPALAFAFELASILLLASAGLLLLHVYRKLSRRSYEIATVG